ncbi:MAG: PKD domain-containing protein, partial [Gammaproteobacteria bacterium]
MSRGPRAKILVLLASVLVSATAFAGCFGPPPEPPVNQAPFASASSDRELVTEGSVVAFTAEGVDADGTIDVWRWDFGDGSTATGRNTTHAYSEHGRFYVTLNVTDNGGRTYDTIAQETPLRVDVLPNFPPETPDDQPLAQLALWSATTVIRPNTELSWSADTSLSGWNASAPSPAVLQDYSMNFGDGSAAVAHTQAELDAHTWDGNFTHTYATAGKHVATLTVTTNTSKTDKALWTVVVIPAAPTPGVIKNPDTMIIETIGQPETLDPAIAYDSGSGEIIEAVYETLITYDGNRPDRFVPLLAQDIPTIQNGLITNNNMTYT